MEDTPTQEPTGPPQLIELGASTLGGKLYRMRFEGPFSERETREFFEQACILLAAIGFIGKDTGTPKTDEQKVEEYLKTENVWQTLRG